mgnify:CR=1 FL=1
MKPSTAWIVYSALRLLFFAVPFAVLYFIGWHWLLSAVVATLIAVSLSVIFLSKQRATAAQSIQTWRDQERTADDIVEDDAVEAASDAGSSEEPQQPAA